MYVPLVNLPVPHSSTETDELEISYSMRHIQNNMRIFPVEDRNYLAIYSFHLYGDSVGRRAWESS